MQKKLIVGIVAILATLLVSRIASPPVQQDWQAWNDPSDAGFDEDALEVARAFADGKQSGAVMVVFRGKVLTAWGDIERKFMAHSVRKSLVSAVYGILEKQGTVDLDATLDELGIDDNTPLTIREKQARVRDVIAARSGVYLPAAYAPSDQDERRPDRGSHAPGTNWFYNNWDFNIAGVIAEQQSDDDLYELFDHLIAEPIGMEDYQTTDGFIVYEPGLSRHPAHTFRVSTRDLARFGQLYLDHGKWHGHQVVPAAWVAQSTAPVSDFGDESGYGFMWWTFESGHYGDSLPELDKVSGYMARGTGGQMVLIIPDEDLVFVHRGDTDNGRGVSHMDVLSLVDQILAAHTGEARRTARPRDVAAIPFTTQRPAPKRPDFLKLEPAQLLAYTGEYSVSPEMVLSVFEWKRRIFMAVPGRGEAELFAIGPDHFTIQVVSGVDIQFKRNDADRVEKVEMALGPQRFVGTKTR